MKTKRLFRTEAAHRDYPTPSRWPQGLHCPRCGYARLGAPRPSARQSAALLAKKRDPFETPKTYRPQKVSTRIKRWLLGGLSAQVARTRLGGYDEFAFRAPRPGSTRRG